MNERVGERRRDETGNTEREGREEGEEDSPHILSSAVLRFWISFYHVFGPSYILHSSRRGNGETLNFLLVIAPGSAVRSTWNDYGLGIFVNVKRSWQK